MLKQLRDHLAALPWKDGDTPPAVTLELYFDGNSEEECIAPNQWGEGRPPIAELYRRFNAIAQCSDVHQVLVGLHSDWNEDTYADSYPPAENIHIVTTASKSEVESWLSGLHSDGVVKGWPYGKPVGATEPPKGYTVFSVCWD
jgi:hypothetical protein